MRRALVLGGGWCLWRDLQALSEITGFTIWPWLVLAVNDAGWAYRHPIGRWVTLHGEKLPVWKSMREQMGYDMTFTAWGGTWVTGRDDTKLEGIERVHPVTRVGSSGMHAVEIALAEGADRVAVVGVPMDGGGHFFDPKPWDSALSHRDCWTEAAAEDWGDRVRSLSGWTSELLKTPDRDWLQL